MLRYEVRFPRCGFTVIRNDTSLEVLSGPEEERVLWPAEALRVCLVIDRLGLRVSNLSQSMRRSSRLLLGILCFLFEMLKMKAHVSLGESRLPLLRQVRMILKELRLSLISSRACRLIGYVSCLLGKEFSQRHSLRDVAID